jgi:hypothetical protein
MKPPVYYEQYFDKDLIEKRIKVFKKVEKRSGRKAAMEDIDRVAKGIPDNMSDLREKYRAYFYYKLGYIGADVDLPPREGGEKQ